MHTVWVRLNAVFFFGLTVLLGLSILAALSKYNHSNRNRPIINALRLNTLRSLKNHGGVDRALLSFDLHVSVFEARPCSSHACFYFLVVVPMRRIRDADR
jgi:signal peptidase complex subunit 3